LNVISFYVVPDMSHSLFVHLNEGEEIDLQLASVSDG